MNRLGRAGLMAALSLACIDGQAKVVDHCITMLEARPAGVDAPPPAPRKPCPIAIGHPSSSRASGARNAATAPAPPDAPIPLPRLEAAYDEADALEPVHRAWHV